MKKRKIIFALVSIASLLININVYAGTSATARITSYSATNIKNNVNGSWETYHNTVFSVSMGGTTYEGFCMDPGYRFHTSTDSSVICDETKIKSYQYLFENRDKVSQMAFEIAERIVSQYEGTSHYPPKEGGIAFYNFAHDINSSYSKYFTGDDATLSSATELARKAIKADSESSSSSSGSSDKSKAIIKFKKVTGENKNCGTVTYNVTSNIEIENVQFTCTQNCTIVDSSFDGTKGTVVVQPTKQTTCDENSLKIHMTWDGAYSSDNKVYICYKASSNVQHLLVGNAATTGKDYEDGLPGSCRSGDCCCNPEEDLSNPTEIDINNCCTADTESNLREHDLNDLFCYDNTVKVNYFLDKCDNAQYDATGTTSGLNEYCSMYCTERVKINTPTSITAVSGKYFSLTTQTIDGFTTTAPYLREVRRCRIKIDYAKWDKAYKSAIVDEVDEFNSFQENKANYEIYNSATESTVSGTIAITASCTVTSTYTGSDGKTHTSSSTSTCATGSYDYTYKKYTFAKTSQKYGSTKFDESSYAAHTKFKAESAGVKTATHAKNSVYQRSDAVEGLNKEKASVLSSCSCSGSKSVSSGEIPDGSLTEEDVNAKRETYNANSEVASDSYNADLDTAFTLEQYLLDCNNYYENTTPEDGYDTSEVNLKFTYDQIYRDESGYKKLEETPIEFKGAFDDKVCKLEKFDYASFTENDNDIFPDQYSEIYGSSTAQGVGMKGKYDVVTYGSGGKIIRTATHEELELTETSSEINEYVRQEGEGYIAKKRFSYDFVYKATCGWLEEKNTIKTLVPGGLASTSQISKNFVIHEQQYQLYLTTFEGNYETNWDLTGIGNGGRLDKWFKDTKTCTEEYAHTNHTTGEVTFSCYVKVTNELIKTGKCNPPTGATAAYQPDSCDSICTGSNCSLDYNFQYKTVDTSKLFVSTTTSDGAAYAANWTDTEEGKTAQSEIEQSGSDDTTFSPENKTYSITLTTNLADEIREYNETQNNEGGYEDFELTCTCAANGGTTLCTQCKSSFLEDNIDKSALNSARNKVHWKSDQE